MLASAFTGLVFISSQKPCPLEEDRMHAELAFRLAGVLNFEVGLMGTSRPGQNPRPALLTTREKQNIQARQMKKIMEKEAAQMSKDVQVGKARPQTSRSKKVYSGLPQRKVSKRTATNRPDEKFGF
ncbi:hypothetical protein LA080_001611 [Diaporthe eres]|uniref:Uncharacterized protein n=1 Tax=Diaporthe vaccinii TaxID=105482 RepID=A0ABR4EIR2_9PEZI|nr:hypothetical protein LA080_001611 [Diaporthe eres]